MEKFFVKVTFTTGGETWINLNLVTNIKQVDEGITTEIYFTNGKTYRVVETPKEILGIR